jgi:hypothetical protein
LKQESNEMQNEPVREVSLDEWGKALLEELLFRAAGRVSERAGEGAFVEVALTFRLTADDARDCIEIRTEGGAEAPLVTRLPRPF